MIPLETLHEQPRAHPPPSRASYQAVPGQPENPFWRRLGRKQQAQAPLTWPLIRRQGPLPRAQARLLDQGWPTPGANLGADRTTRPWRKGRGLRGTSLIQTFAIGIALAAVGLLPALLFGQEEPPGDPPVPEPRIAWFSDLGEALLEARKQEQLVLLMLEDSDQLWSRKTLESFADAQVLKLLEGYTPVRINLKFRHQWQEQWKIQSIPDLRVFDSQGRQLAQRGGHQPPEALREFLTASRGLKPRPDAPTLSMLLPGNELDPLLKLRETGRLPDQLALESLLDLAGGTQGETRVEARRLLAQWAPLLRQPLVEQLASGVLRRRIVAYEALSELNAPLVAYDPWQGLPGAELRGGLNSWVRESLAKPLPASAQPAPGATGDFPALTPEQRKVAEADLALLAGGDERRAEAAWQRLAGTGPGLTPLLRTQARSAAETNPGLSLKLDQLRFRLLLSAEALRRQPGAALRLAGGPPGQRATTLQALLRSGAEGLELLAREASCDPDPLFREMALRNLGRVMAEPGPLLREALKDPEPNVRVAALAEIANSGGPENGQAIRAYIQQEPGADMLGHAIRALSTVKTATSRATLRGLLEDPRWQVQAAAAEALAELEDREAFPALLGLLKSDDGFVAGAAIKALGKAGDESALPAFAAALEKHPSLAPAMLKILRRSFSSSPRAFKIIQQLCASPEAQVRALALPAFVSMAQDKNSGRYQGEGGQGDGKAKRQLALSLLEKGLQDSAPQVRTAAVEAFRELLDEKELEALRSAGKHPPEYRSARPRILAFLKASEKDLALQAALTLACFGDWAEAQEHLGACFTDPDPRFRAEAYDCLPHIPEDLLLALIRKRFAAQGLREPEGDLSTLLYKLYKACPRKAAQWKEGEPVAEAAYEVLLQLGKEHHADWCDRLGDMALENDDEPSSSPNRKGLGSWLSRKVALKPAEPVKDTLEIFYCYQADLDEKALADRLADPREEMARAAAARLVGNQQLGPREWALKWILDPRPVMRRLGVVACIPGAFRRELPDPSRYLVVHGQTEYWSRNTNYFSLNDTYPKRPRVVELPIERLEALLQDQDEEVRILTAFLMALEGGGHGIPVLEKAFKAHRDDDQAEILELAIAMAWSDDFTPQLRQLYAFWKERENDYELKEFYRRIRILSGARVKQLRLEMVKELPALKG